MGNAVKIQVWAVLVCGMLFLAAGSWAMTKAEAGILSPDDAVMVSKSAFDSAEPYGIIDSNNSVVSFLGSKFLKPNEISRAALMSYYVDYYLAQVNNGGFSQFVYNCTHC